MPTISCVICSKNKYVKPSHLLKGWGKYCSKDCQNESMRTGEYQKCTTCQKVVYKNQTTLKRSLSKEFFCTKSCQAVWRNKKYVNDSHPNWKDGNASYRKVLLRSNQKLGCGKCGLSDIRILAVHHKDKNHANNNIGNLMWLCHNCHYLVHHYVDESNGFLVA